MRSLAARLARTRELRDGAGEIELAIAIGIGAWEYEIRLRRRVHDQQVRCRRGDLGIGFAESELELQGCELRIHDAHGLRRGAVAALPLAQLSAAVCAGESHCASLVSVETGPASTTGTPAPSPPSTGSGSPDTRASFLASFSCWRALRAFC